MNNETKAMTIAQESIEPRTMADRAALAEAAGKSGFFGAKNKDQALLLMMCGRDLGLSYTQSLRAFHINSETGKPGLSADGMVAVCLKRRDVCEYFRTIAATNEQATVETKRVGEEPARYSFTLADAKIANLAGKANWQKYPSRMLLARAKAALARDQYPDLLLGMYDPDELEESSPARVEMRAAPAATTPVEAVATAAAPDPSEALVTSFAERFERIGREGTREEYQALVREVTASSLSSAQRGALASGVASEAATALRHRMAAKAQADQAFAPGAT